MGKSYYIPASRRGPVLPLGLAWLLWLTSKHVAWPGWVWGMVWTLWGIIFVILLVSAFTRTAYSEDKMDRILGDG